MNNLLMLEQRVSRLEKLLKNEAKQVGTLYHSTALTTAMNFIIAEDTLQSSERYRPNKLSGTRDIVYFSRNRSIANINFLTGSDVVVTLVVDGDKLSEKYKVFPYNYFGFDQETDIHGNVSIPDSPNIRQQEECVRGPIKNISKYTKEIIVRFNDTVGKTQWWTDTTLSDNDLNDLIDSLGNYCNKHNIKLTGDKVIVDRIKGKMSVAKRFASQPDNDYEPYTGSGANTSDSSNQVPCLKINVKHSDGTETFYFVCKDKVKLISLRASLKNLVYSLVDFDGDEDILESLFDVCKHNKVRMASDGKSFDSDYFLEAARDFGYNKNIVGKRADDHSFISRSNKEYKLNLIDTINVTVADNA